MSHTILRGAMLVLSADRASGAPEGMYCLACLTCQAVSGWVDSDAKAVGVWAIAHTQRHGLTHSQFRLSTQRYWRVDPIHSAPSPSPSSPPRQPRPGHAQHLGRAAHARPRRQGPLRAALRWAVAALF